jgi:hypothetical protein
MTRFSEKMMIAYSYIWGLCVTCTTILEWYLINSHGSLNTGIDENEDNFSSVTIKEEPFDKEDFAPVTESDMNIDKPEEVKMELNEDLSFELMPT